MKLASISFALLALSGTVFAEQKLGQPLTQKAPVTVAALLENPAPMVGKTVQVQGKVVEVCEAMGCWMNLTDDQGHLLRIGVEDGVIVFPTTAVGKQAIAEGKLEKQVLTKEQVIAAAKHEAEDAGRKFDAAKVKGSKTVYSIAGSGAVILDQ